MLLEVLIPRLNPNDDEVFLAEVLVREGQKVAAGDELFVIETMKAAVSVEAEKDGYVLGLAVRQGDDVPAGAVACYLADSPDETLPGKAEVESKEISKLGAEGSPKQGTAGERLRAKRAKAKSSTGQRLKQVRDWPDSSKLEWVAEIRCTMATLAQSAGPELKGFDNIESLAGSKANHVGRGASMGAGSRVKARAVYLGKGASIGRDCDIEADTVYIGAHAHVGHRVSMVSGELVLGDGTYVDHDTEVDLGGGRSAESRLLAGPACLIGARCLVNTCREVVMEPESALSPGVSVFTHSFWQSVLDGYPARFQGIWLESGAWVGAGCQVQPGTLLRNGATVMSNSTAGGEVASGRMAGGIPARDLGPCVSGVPDQVRRVEIMRDILEDFASHLSFKGCTAERKESNRYSVALPDGGTREIVLLTEEEQGASQEGGASALVITFGPIPETSLALYDLAAQQFTGSLEPLAHELRNFLRRRGIRFQPYGWNASFRHGLAAVQPEPGSGQ